MPHPLRRPTVTATDQAFADFQKQEEKKRKKEMKSKSKDHAKEAERVRFFLAS